MIPKRIKLVIISFLISAVTFSQKQGQQLCDSLVQQIPFAKNDTATARLYKAIAENYTAINPTAARLYADKGLAVATQMKWTKGVAVFNAIIATLYNDAGLYDSALYHNKKALDIHKKNYDAFNTASVLNNMGVICQRQSKFTEATAYFFESLKVSEANKNTRLIAQAYSNIATVYAAQKDYKKDLDYNFKALRIQEQENNTDDIAATQAAIATTYMETADDANAAAYYDKALRNYTQTGNQFGIATVYTNMATLQKTNYAAKLHLALKADSIWNIISPGYLLAIINTGNIGVAYLDIAKDKTGISVSGKNIPDSKNEQLQKAVVYLNKAIAASVEAGDVNNEAFFTGNLAEAQELAGDYKNAYINFRRYQQVQDSVYSQENKNKIAAIEGEREVAIRDTEIAFNKKALANEQKLKWALAAGLLLLLCIAGLLFYQNKTRKKVNTTLLTLNTELDEANKVKAKFFGILSHDLRSPVANLVNFLQLQKRSPGVLTETQIAEREAQISTSAASLLETMESMLLWSKGQMENFKPEKHAIAVTDLFEYLQKFFSGNNNIRFSFITDDQLTVYSDENYLQTIMQNLTANAIKALRQTPGAAIEWKAWKENNKTYFSITDNGPGISAEQAKTLFTETNVTGTKHGLGLHIIKDLAKAISCSITVQPANNGSCFTLSI